MAKILLFCIVSLLALTILSMFTGNDLFSVSIEASYSFESLNGTISDLDVDGSFSLTTLQEAITWISVAAGIAVASGITILASGMNERASHWLTYSIFFVALWSILSALSFPLIIAIEIFGSVIYLILTIAYGVAAILYIGNSG